MKVAAIVSTGIVAGAGLLFLWQASRAPAGSAYARRRPPVASPGAAVATTRTDTPPETARRQPSMPGVDPDAPAESIAANREQADVPISELPATGKRKLLGAVLGEAGPLPGAQVLVLERGQPVAETNTDGQGRFEITHPVPIEHAALRILARGYAAFERTLGNPRRPGQEHLGNLKVLRGSVLSGLVVDDSGRPVAGVELGMGLWSGDYDDPRILERTRTGPDGAFRFANAPRGRITLTTSVAGWADRTVEHTHGLGEEARIQLVRASTLRLFVHTPDGQPVAGARVQIQSTNNRGKPREGQTDGEGHALFDNLDAEVWSVRVNLAQYKPTGLPAAAADGIEQRIELVPWPCIRGLVLTDERQPAPPGTRVVALPGGTRGDVVQIGTGGTLVDEEGGFRICDVRPGSYVVQASAPGFATTSSHVVQVGATGDLDLGAIVLLHGGTLALQLVTQDGPASGVQVEIHRTQPVPAQLWAASAVRAADVIHESDVEGRVSIANLSSGEAWVILRGPQLVPRQAGPFSLSEGRQNEPAPIELAPGITLHGRVLDKQGAGLPRARIVISGPETPPTHFCQDDGGFRLPPLPPGKYRLHATAHLDGGMRDTPTVEVELTRGQPAPAVDLTFE